MLWVILLVNGNKIIDTSDDNKNCDCREQEYWVISKLSRTGRDHGISKHYDNSNMQQYALVVTTVLTIGKWKWQALSKMMGMITVE